MDLHELKLLLQRQLGDGLVVIVGSGLSCAEGLPSMGALSAHLQASIGTGLEPADAECWLAISSNLASMGLEAAMLQTAPTSSLEAAIAAATAAFVGDRERKVIGEVFAKARTLSFTRLLPHLMKPDTGLPVITTNYDRLIEVACEEADLGVDTMFVGDFAGTLNERESRLSFCREVTLRRTRVQYRYRPRVNVCKPHGSLDWYHREGRPVRYSGDLSIPRLIITPGLNKFRNGYNSPFDRHRERANLAIDQAARFLIIGYGFNDDHLETHLKPRIQSGIPTLLLTHSLSVHAMALALQCPGLIAIQHAVSSGAAGSTIIANGIEFHVPSLALWSLDGFIREVLEP